MIPIKDTKSTSNNALFSVIKIYIKDQNESVLDLSIGEVSGARRRDIIIEITNMPVVYF